MGAVIDRASAIIESRLREIEDEQASLREALKSLGGKGTAAAAPTAKRQSKKTRRRKRAPRGQRKAQFLDAVKGSKGMPAAEVAREIGVSTNQAYALGERLVKDGVAKKGKAGYRPV